MKNQWLYKLSAALMIVMLAVTALPIKNTKAAGGLPTRFYLQNATAAVATATRGAWDATGGLVTRAMSTTKSGAIATVAVAETSNTNNYDVLMLKFISEPIPAQTIAAGSTLSWVIGSLESAGQANMHYHVHAYVVSNDGATLRGTLLNNDIDADEWSTTDQGDAPSGAKSLTAVTAQANDRIVIEIGYQAQNNSATSRTGTLWYGGTGGDLTDGGNETTMTGWFEFSQDLYPLNTTTPGTATATGASATSINVSMPYVDDGNANNTYVIDYKLSSSGVWTNLVPSAAHAASPYTYTVTGLAPATSYDVRVTYNDADGVTGASQQTISNVTTPFPELNPWTATPQATATTGNPAAFNYSISAGSNRLFIVAVDSYDANGNSGQTFNVTYGGKPLTQAVLQNDSRRQTWIGYLKESDIATKAGDSVVVTVTGAHTNVAVWVASYSGVNQTTPVVATGSFYENDTTATPIFPSSISVNAGGYGIYTWASNETHSGDNESYTEEGENTTGGFSSGIATRPFSSSGSTQPTITFANVVRSSVSLVVLNPAPALVTPTLSISNSSVPYNGSPQAANVSCSSGGAVSNILYGGSPTTPTNAATYAVTADCAAVAGFTSLTDAPAGNFVISQVSSTVTVTCTAGAPYTYTGSAQTPCTAQATGAGMSPVDVTASLIYSNNTNAGAATANASWAGDANHTGNTGSGGFTIGQASSAVTVTCTAGAPYTFTGSAQTPCTAQSTGVGMSPVDVTASLIYSNNTNAGAATANASWAGDANHTGNTGSGGFTIGQASSAVTVTCTAGAPYTFTGSAQTPCTAQATGVGMSPVDVTASLVYSNNTNAGAATANASWAGDTNHTGNTGSGGFTIGQASSTVSVTCTAGAPYTFTGSAQSPCTAEATGVGMSPVDVTASLIYSNNTDAGAATANASWAGDTNHTGNTGSGGFTIGQASSTVTVTCPVAVQLFTGSAQTPCTAEATGIGMSPVDVTASLIYSNNTNAGAATANASWAGDTNHTGNTGSGGFTIGQASSTVTVTCTVGAPYAFTGSAQTPCTAEATGAGMSPVDVTASLIYSNNTNAGAATANASWGGDANHAANTGSGGFTINQVSSTVTVTCPVPSQPYTGSAQTPCTAEATGIGMTPVDLTASISYSNNINAGSATANASWAGDVNHTGNTGSGGFTISQVSSTVTVTCPVAVQPFTGSAQTPCTAEATGIGMTPVDLTASISYSNNTNLGSATANASWAGDTNHTGNNGSGGFTIGQATSTVTVTCPASVPYTGLPLTPCTAQATGAGMSPVDVTASLVYSNNTVVGTATADASWAGDTNHTGNTGTNTFAIGQASQTINVTTSAPTDASNSSTFDVVATATSGLPVTITTSGVCTGGDTDGTATITMTSGSGTCSVFYNQTGNGNYSAASQVQQDVNATEGPSFTSANNTSFDFGFPGSFIVTAVGNPSSMTITLGGSIPAGVSLTNVGLGSETLSSTAATPVGVYNLTLTAANGVLPNATQNFTLTVRNGPIVSLNGINSTPDTGDGSVGENEAVIDTLGLTKLTVQIQPKCVRRSNRCIGLRPRCHEPGKLYSRAQHINIICNHELF